MTDYKTRSESQPLKWLVALVIFMLTLGLTFSNVYGLNVPPAKTGGGAGSSYEQPSATVGDDSTEPVQPSADPGDSTDDDNPDAVPEPGTLILLAVGLGAAYAKMRKKI